MDVIFTGISQVDTIGNFDFKLYKNNILGYNSRHYMVPLASYNVYDTRYKLTELESKDAQGSIEYNQVIMYRGIMDNQYTKYTAISYSSNNKIHHGYLITPKDKPPRLQRILKYDLSVRELEDLLHKSTEKIKERKPQDPIITSWEDKLAKSLGSKVKIDKKGDKGFIKINFFSHEELKNLLDKLE